MDNTEGGAETVALGPMKARALPRHVKPRLKAAKLIPHFDGSGLNLIKYFLLSTKVQSNGQESSEAECQVEDTSAF